MDKNIAQKIAKEKLKAVLQEEEATIVQLLQESDHGSIAVKGVWYQFQVDARWEEKGKIISVCVAIDDMTFSSWCVPLCESDWYYLSKDFQQSYVVPPSLFTRLLATFGLKK